MKKAGLLSCGRVLVPRGLQLPVPRSRSSAGPGGGTTSLFFRSAGRLLRLEVVREGTAPLVLRGIGGRFDILKGGRVAARGVELVNAGFHAPGQAFINIHDECRYDCAFCSLPVSPGKGPSMARWTALIKDALRSGKVDAVALTSGIPDSPSKACRDMARMVRAIRRGFPSAPLGVEPYTVDAHDLRLLKKAGADELKLNIQCATPGLLARVCPSLDGEGIMRNLEAGAGIFGRGKVCSNLIVGFGETDGDVLAAVERLAGMGVAANLRMLRVNALNRERLERALGRAPRPPSAERMLRLAAAQKKLFARHGLGPGTFRTMCHRCTACDVEPFTDI